MKNNFNPVIMLLLICFWIIACSKSNSPNSNPPGPTTTGSGCRLTGVTYRSHQTVDSQSTTLDYDDKGRLIQAYANPGGITTHFNYRSDGKLSTITSSSVPYIDTVVYAGDNISAVVVLAADHTPMDTTIFSVNPDGWITDVRVNLRITRLSPSIYGHITYNYENNQLKTVSQSVENLQPIHPTSVFLPNNLPVDDPKNPFASISRETLFLFYEIFNRDALGSFWTVGNIEDLNYTDPTKVIDEEQYVYRLDSNKNVVHRDVLLASDAPGFSTFLISSDNNYTYDCK